MSKETSSRSAGFSQAPEEQEGGWEFVAFAWRRKWMVLVFALIGLGLGYLFFLRQTPVYQSIARVLIVKEGVKLPIQGVELSPTYDSTHEAVISSQVVLEKAVYSKDAPGPARDLTGLESLKGFFSPETLKYLDNPSPNAEPQAREAAKRALADAAISMLNNLKVKGVGSDTGDILELRYESLVRDECPKVLNAIVEAYEAFLGSTQEDESAEAARLIQDAMNNLTREIDDAVKKYQEFKAKADLVYLGESALNAHERILQQVDMELSQLVLANTRLQAEIATLTRASEQSSGNQELLRLLGDAFNLVLERRPESEPVGEKTKPVPTLKPAVAGTAKPEPEAAVAPAAPEAAPVETAAVMTQDAEAELMPLLLEEQTLLGSYGEQHPRVVAIRKRIELTRELLARRRAESDARKRPDSLQLHLASLYEQLAINDQIRQQLNDLRNEHHDQAKRLSEQQAQDQSLRSDIERKERLYNAVVTRLEELKLARQGTKKFRVKLIDPPSPAFQVRPDFKVVMAVAGVLGMLVGLGLAYAVEAADRRFRSPDEIRVDLGVPVVGHIPVIPVDERPAKKGEEADSKDRLSAVLRVHHYPRGRIAEAYRAVRTAIYFSQSSERHKVIQVTSPQPGDGKTTLSANLAVSIAHSGKKALLMDCDFRRPRCHTLFGVDSETGLRSVIDGDVEICDAVVPTPVENLWLLPCGPRPDKPSELLTSPRFEQLLDVLRQQYDYIVVDTPPALVVTDPLNVAPRVDCVLLVMRLTKNARAVSHRALEALEDVGGNVTGVVVNGLGGAHGGYGRYTYGKYSYGYGYAGYGYRYGYSYGYGGRYGYGGYAGYGSEEGDGDGYGYGSGYLDDHHYYAEEDHAEQPPRKRDESRTPRTGERQ